MHLRQDVIWFHSDDRDRIFSTFLKPYCDFLQKPFFLHAGKPIFQQPFSQLIRKDNINKGTRISYNSSQKQSINKMFWLPYTTFDTLHFCDFFKAANTGLINKVIFELNDHGTFNE